MTEQPTASAASGLVAFRVENFRSIRDRSSLSMQAMTLAEPGAVRHVPVMDSRRTLPLLPAAAIFGANATGKSNVLKALNLVRLHVELSFKSNSPSGVALPYEPFALDERYASKPTTLELEAIIDGVLHTYGFAYDSSRYIGEWAYHSPLGRSRLLFRRNPTGIVFGPTTRTQGNRIANLLRPNALFLSTAAALNFEPLLPLHTWIFPNFRLAHEGNRDGRKFLTYSMVEERLYADRILNLVRAADLGIIDLVQDRTMEVPERIAAAIAAMASVLSDGTEQSPDVPAPITLQILHQGESGPIAFDQSQESNGTLTWIALLGLVVRSLTAGLILLADELDASLHPALVHQLLLLFQDPRTNPRGAQLIFTTHDTTMLGDSSGERIIGRDQVWLAEKNTSGVSRLYPLGDLSPRKEEAVAKRYLAGRYGGTPILSQGDFRGALSNDHNGDDDGSSL